MFKLFSKAGLWTEAHDAADVTAMKFAPDDKCLAIGSFNGSISIRVNSIGRLMYRLPVSPSFPISSIKWHPSIPNVILAATANGKISCWHSEASQQLWSLQEPKNDVNSIDISSDGSILSSVGSDCVVRVYDLHTHTLTQSLQQKEYIRGKVTGHSNRIYSCIFKDKDTLVSSGWDNSVILWDLRSGDIEKTFYGTHLSGESMLFANENLVTGSCRSKDQIQVWDLRKEEAVRTVSIGNVSNPLLIYSMAATPDKKYVAAGGCGLNCVAILDTSNYSIVYQTSSFERGVNCVDFSHSFFAYGLSDSTVTTDRYLISA